MGLFERRRFPARRERLFPAMLEAAGAGLYVLSVDFAEGWTGPTWGRRASVKSIRSDINEIASGVLRDNGKIPGRAMRIGQTGTWLSSVGLRDLKGKGET
tara:strand:- start:108 stop:407 length:300 start_codon:yes stop_codon:yes gene_type:complete